MLLTIDVSNSTIKAGVFDGDQLVAFWQIATERRKAVDDYAMLFLNLFRSSNIKPKAITGVSISCVVPQLRSVFRQLCIRYLKVTPFLVGPDAKIAIRVDLDYPSEVGGDRITNASATYALYGGPAIAIAFGTATVFDCISEDGTYLGGAIAPGMIGALESLTERAAQLFKVELIRPPLAIAKNSMHAIQSGMIFGYTGLVERLVQRLKAELATSSSKPVQVVATGGLADVISPETDEITVVDHQLTLKGLRLVYDLNKD
ncbi:type III pantothenate kinase [Desulfosarcina ovata subsp. sediminis]|uniref:Type III pantothenate kinase n=1 Tax=Desulfosarcina ovata subsp. sediminis TaxID=885957 RepID=A0A5K7ZUJ0_9BACT|nr:type III pantothenate kinase [Desulfosarcina ovata]BBO83870.1 type III pantothenate kinase [Desulfosarcina ovata subsp. sediminis]